MGNELVSRKGEKKITPKMIMAAEIMKAFVLKCFSFDVAAPGVFASAAIQDEFTVEEVQKACFDASRDANLRKITYADIYERAKVHKAERLRKIEWMKDREEIAWMEEEKKLCEMKSKEEKEEEQKQLREEARFWMNKNNLQDKNNEKRKEN